MPKSVKIFWGDQNYTECISHCEAASSVHVCFLYRRTIRMGTRFGIARRPVFEGGQCGRCIGAVTVFASISPVFWFFIHFIFPFFTSETMNTTDFPLHPPISPISLISPISPISPISLISPISPIPLISLIPLLPLYSHHRATRYFILHTPTLNPKKDLIWKRN